MGYTTDFHGSIKIEPALSQEEADFLNAFSGSRRMNRAQGPYHIGSGDFGQDRDDDIVDYNQPPPGQPGLWCQWVTNEDCTAIEWDGGEKFYCAEEWMQYIIEHFIGSDPVAKKVDPEAFAFLQGHTLTGEIFAEGEETGDLWKIEVRDNVVTRVEGHVSYEDAYPPDTVESQPDPSTLKLATVRTHLKMTRESWDKQVEGSPHLNVSRETFEIFLRDLEEAAGLR